MYLHFYDVDRMSLLYTYLIVNWCVCLQQSCISLAMKAEKEDGLQCDDVLENLVEYKSDYNTLILDQSITLILYTYLCLKDLLHCYDPSCV